MDFSWTAEQNELYERILAFATSLPKPIARPSFDREQWNRLGEFGALGLCVPESLGGLGLSALDTARATKHGLIGLTKALALEVAAQGVRVNAVAPGLTETDMVAGLPEKQRERLLRLVPMRRVGQPQEVAETVHFVLTQATYATGNVFHVGGGVVMG